MLEAHTLVDGFILSFITVSFWPGFTLLPLNKPPVEGGGGGIVMQLYFRFLRLNITRGKREEAWFQFHDDQFQKTGFSEHTIPELYGLRI